MQSEKTISRLTLYRRVLSEYLLEGKPYLHSHELAKSVGASAAQVRRDLMAVGYEGTPKRGYDTEALLNCLQDYLVDPKGQRLALVGVGNIGQAMLSYFQGGRSHLNIVAAFDLDPHKGGRVICGCRCYPLEDLETIVKKENISVAILAVPADATQQIADKLVECGVCGLVNFAPTPLKVPATVFVENVDVTMALEKAAFFARRTTNQSKTS